MLCGIAISIVIGVHDFPGYLYVMELEISNPSHLYTYVSIKTYSTDGIWKHSEAFETATCVSGLSMVSLNKTCICVCIVVYFA